MRARLGPIQLHLLNLLRQHRSYTSLRNGGDWACGWGCHSRTIRVLESLVRKSLVLKTTDEFGHATYTLFQP